MTPRSLWASMVWPGKASITVTSFTIYTCREVIILTSHENLFFFFLPFMCPSPFPMAFLPCLSLLPSSLPPSCCLFISKPYLLGPDCKAHKYSTFPRSNLWMLFHHSVLLPHPIRNGARLYSGSLASTPWALHYQHGGLIFLSKILIIKGLPTVTLEPFMDSNLDRCWDPHLKRENFQIFHHEKVYLFQSNNPVIKRGEGKIGTGLEL